MDCWGASTQRGPMYSPQGANQAIDEFSAAKTKKFNLSTTVQKSVQLALQNRGQGTRPYPPILRSIGIGHYILIRRTQNA